MFDISALKEMKLSELQEIAKSAKTIKFNGVKKDTLIGSILEHQNNTVDSTPEKQAETKVEDDKPKRTRIVPVKKAAIQKATVSSLFAKEEATMDAEFQTKMEVSAEVAS